MTRLGLIGAGVAVVAAALLWPRHPQKDALPPAIAASASGAAGATVRRPARQEVTEDKRRQIAELGALIHGVARARRAEAEQVRKQAAVVHRAKATFELATKAYQEERFVDAVESFRDAYELVPHPDFLYNAGIAYQRAGNCREANFYFDWYLAESPRLRDNQDPSISDATPSLSSQMSFALDATRRTCR